MTTLWPIHNVFLYQSSPSLRFLAEAGGMIIHCLSQEVPQISSYLWLNESKLYWVVPFCLHSLHVDTDSDCLVRAHLDIFPPPLLAPAFRSTFRPIPMPLGWFLIPPLLKRLRYAMSIFQMWGKNKTSLFVAKLSHSSCQ